MSEVVEAQTTLRDQLEAAFDNHDQPQTQVIEQKVDQTTDTVQEAKQDRARDEAGRFAPKQETKQETKPDSLTSTPENSQQQAPVAKPRPTSWKKDYEEHWGKLDPTLQEYLIQREADYAKGVSMYKQNWTQAEPIYQAIQPFMPVLQQHNIQPQQWISSLGNAHLALVQGSPEQKLQMFAKLANDYGVPLQALTGQQYDPQFSMLAQELGQLRNQWSEFQTQREQMEQAQIQGEISSFSKDKPHFEAVRETMAQLLQSGVAGDLQSAYDKAIRLHDDIWQQQQEQARQAQSQAAAQANQQQVAKAKAAAVSPRSISPTANMGSGNGKKSLRDILGEQVESHLGAGRV